MEKYAIIVAGGSGSRMGSSVPKQFLVLRNKPVLWYTVTAFLDAFRDLRIILVLPKQYFSEGNEIVQSTSSPGRVEITEGGQSRFESVQNGLALVPNGCVVFVHDGVRCLVSTELINRCYEATLKNGNAIPAIGAIDTIRIETAAGSEMIERSKVKLIQTPQTFMSTTLKSAYQQNYHQLFTDDASVVESLGQKIHLIEGEVNNIKITRKIDLLIAYQILVDRDAI